MPLETEPFLIAVGLMIVAAFFGSLAFRRFRIPDILLLLGVGVTLGPLLHFVDVDTFRAIIPVAGTVAIIIILFDGGLNIRITELAGGVASASLLAVLVFAATALLCGITAHLVAGMDTGPALLLGMALGGAGVVIVIPLIRQLGVGDRAKTIVNIEAATSDVLVVVGVVGFSTALAVQRTDPQALAQSLVQTFSVGIALGIVAGALWARGLRRFAQRSYEYVLTIASLFLLYAGVELVGGSGALGVLAFGLVLGNSRKTRRLDPEAEAEARRKKKRRWEYAPVFGHELVNLHEELVFFIRAFFFVALGVTLDLAILATWRFVLVGFLLSLGVIVARFWGVTLLFGRSRLEMWDKLGIALMFPVGLAAAAISLLPWQRFRIPGTQDLGNYAAAVIVLTNVLSTVLVFVVSQPRIRETIARSPEAPSASPSRAAESD